MEKIQPSYELKLANRFIVKFPKEFDIQEWLIQSIETPKYIDGNWSNITIKFIDVIGKSSSIKIYNSLITKKIDNFKIILEYLDPTGVVVSSADIFVEKVLSIDFDDLSYNDDKVVQPTIILKVKDFVINY
jgi:hypothetical protein